MRAVLPPHSAQQLWLWRTPNIANIAAVLRVADAAGSVRSAVAVKGAVASPRAEPAGGDRWERCEHPQQQ